MTKHEALLSSEALYGEATLHDLTARLDDYLLHDKRAESKISDEGYELRRICFMDDSGSTRLESHGSPDGVITYSYYTKTTLGLGRSYTNMQWKNTDETAVIDGFAFEEEDTHEATNKDFQSLLVALDSEFGDVKLPMGKKIGKWRNVIGQIVRG